MKSNILGVSFNAVKRVQELAGVSAQYRSKRLAELLSLERKLQAGAKIKLIILVGGSVNLPICKIHLELVPLMQLPFTLEVL